MPVVAWCAATTRWTYDLEGTLVGLPGAQDFGEVDRDCLGLRRVRCEQWGAFVFVNLDDDAGPLLDALGVVGRDLARPDRWRRRRRTGPPRRPPLDRGRRQLEVDGRRQHRDLPRQHHPPDQRGDRARPARHRDLPAARRALTDADPQPHRRAVPDRPARLPATPASWPARASTRTTCSPTRASCSVVRRRSRSSSPAGRSRPDTSLYDVHFLAATPS